MYLSYFMQASRLSRYVRTLWNHIFMGDRIWQGWTILAAKIGPGGPFLAADRFFRYSPINLGCFSHVTTFRIFTRIKTERISNKESKSVIN